MLAIVCSMIQALKVTGYSLLTFLVFGLLISHQYLNTFGVLAFFFGSRGYRALKRTAANHREAGRLSARADAQHSAFLAGDLDFGVFGQPR